MLRTLTILFILASLAGGLASGCRSPLDADTPRKETPLTPAPRVKPITIRSDFDFSGTDYAFKGLPEILVDTFAQPMRFWMDFEMYETGTPTTALIQEFRVKLDSVEGENYAANLVKGEVTMRVDPGTGIQDFSSATSGFLATILIREQERKTGQPRRVEITLYLYANKDQEFFPALPTQEVLGTINLEI